MRSTSSWCAARRHVFGVGCETRPAGLSQQAGEAGDSLTLEVQGRAGSSLDNAGTVRNRQTVRVRQARREGVTRVNQWLNPLKCGTGSNLTDVGRAAARADHRYGKATPSTAIDAGRGGHGEGLRRSRGKAAGAKLGTSLVNRDMVNAGTVRVRPSVSRPGWRRAGPPSTDVHGRGGAGVVVRGRESRLHGEGRQQVRSLGAARPGGRW